MSTTAEEQHLADQLCTTSEAVRESLDALAAADYLAREAGGQITCL